MKAPFAKPADTGIKPVINVTPLVDVVLVLLIIFMVVLPQMQEGGVPIEMVQVEAADEDDPNAPEPLVVTVDANERLILGERELSRAELAPALEATVRSGPARGVLLRGDATVPYEVMRDVFAQIQGAGVKHVKLAVGVARTWNPEESG